MASTCRDRTAEFRSLSQTLKKIGAVSTAHQTEHDPASSKHGSSRSEFNRKASRIGLGIHETSQKIARLAKLAKQSSMFNDRTVEIQELTALIRNDITGLNMGLSDLQTLQNMEIADGNYSEDRAGHSTAVCDDLKTRLMGATKQLQDVLTTRSENIKAHESRKQIFSTKNASRDSTPPQHNVKTLTEPPPWSSPSNPSNDFQPSISPPNNGAAPINHLRRRPVIDNASSNQMEMSMLQQTVPRQESYAQSRATALHSVESTITELSGIFTHLATMVTQQGELAIRIDDNMDESLANVDGAHSSLLRHLNRISSNRWLMIKIFAVVILFLVVFIFLVA
ncbi:PREDICTED: syntaxin-31 isoform X2 [Tarenaya hassleriana]|uniref:syntaxin-31 isoform X2 n=1 Tax=Tarenaya hassleriana TaxID=28532 RepID=UPI00053C0FD3|nr:PREDICTED: syntaxin-31 isoform X2 [Tarenaya hassleriana]